jgi:hypothetical protein
VENNLITLVPQQVHAFIVNDQKGKYCFILFPKVHFSAFPKNHVGFAPKNIKINTHKIEIDCECGKPNVIENMIGCEGINKLLIKLPETQKQDNRIDCGLFSLANAVEFCQSRFKGGTHIKILTKIYE